MHTLDKQKFKIEMEGRGWRFDDAYSWIAPEGSTRRSMEKDWVDSILAAVTCPHSAPSTLARSAQQP